MPESHAYDPKSQTLTVGTGAFSPCQRGGMELRGLRPQSPPLLARLPNEDPQRQEVQPLDDIRPTRWTQTNELLLLLSIIEHTIEVTPKAADLLAQIVQGPLIPAKDLPIPTPANRKPPRT